MNKVPFIEAPPADYLRRVAQSDVGRMYKSLALAELQVGNAHTVVDLGCGPGTDLPDFATATGADGVVIGLDHDPEAMSAATVAARPFPWIRLQVADIHDTALPTGSADRVHADRVLQHVTDPAAVVSEARRLLRPGGRAAFAEPDYDTLVIDYPDSRVPQAFRSFVTARVVRNATIGRQLSRLATCSGFTSVATKPATTVFTEADVADELLGVGRVTRRAVAAGYLDERTAEDWLDYLAAAPFFASMTVFVVTATV